MEEIDWKKEITERLPKLTPEEQRRLQLKNEALKLRRDFRIEEIFTGIKEQILKEGEIIGTDNIDYRISNYLLTSKGCSTAVSLRSGIKIEVPPTDVSIYEGPIGEDRWVGYETVPGYTCEGYHFFTVSVYAGFEDISRTKFCWENGGRDAYLRSSQLKKVGLITAGVVICPVDEDKRRDVVAERQRIFEEYFDRDNFLIEEVRQNLITAIAKYLGAHDLLHAALYRNYGISHKS